MNHFNVQNVFYYSKKNKFILLTDNHSVTDFFSQTDFNSISNALRALLYRSRISP